MQEGPMITAGTRANSISSSLSRLESKVCKVTEILASIETSLSPVLRERCEAPTAPVDVPANMSPSRSNIEASISGIIRIEEQLQSIAERLDI